MLYTLVGNGNANAKEVIHSMASLVSAVSQNDEFWMMLIQNDEPPSDTTQAIVQFLGDQDLYYEVVLPENTDPDETFIDAKNFHASRRPYDRAVTLTNGRVQPGENKAILVLSDDLDSDDNSLYAIAKAIDLGIPVFDLGGQMLQVVLEQAPEIPDAPVEPEPEPVVHETDSPDAVFTREELEALTRDELKNLVTQHNVIPTDMRSKDSMMDALMNQATATVETPVPTIHVHSQQPDGSFVEEDIVARTPDGTVLTNEAVEAMAEAEAVSHAIDEGVWPADTPAEVIAAADAAMTAPAIHETNLPTVPKEKTRSISPDMRPRLEDDDNPEQAADPELHIWLRLNADNTYTSKVLTAQEVLVLKSVAGDE